MTATENHTPHFLVYSDGTEAGETAVKSAIKLALAIGGKLDILAMSDLPFAEHDAYKQGQEMSRDEWSTLTGALHHLMNDVLYWLSHHRMLKLPESVAIREDASGMRLTRVEDNNGNMVRLWQGFGSTYECIYKLSNEYEHDLVITPATTTNLLGRILGKDLTNQLAIDLPTSILVVKDQITPASTFVLCSDGSMSAKRAFGTLRRLHGMIQKPVPILINEGQDPSELLSWMEKHQKAGKVLTTRNDAEDPAEEIMDLIKPNQVAILGASVRAHILRRLQGSVPLDLIRKAPFSVLLSKEIPDVTDQE